MGHSVTLPLWLFLLIAALAVWAFLAFLLLPGVRWYLRRRVDRVIDELNERLRIRIQPFKLTKRQVLIDRLIWDPQVVAAAEAYADEQGLPREVAIARADAYAREIVPAFNAYFYFRLGYWASRRVARFLYRVRIGYAQRESLRELEEGRSTVVFVMNHRSNMDYVLVSYLVASRTALSYAVGEWARVWPLRPLVRLMGAYFVRRGSKNPLYRRVLERYVQMATASGVTQALFPEGRLSRDGRLGEPRLGIFEYLLRGFDPAGERDVVFVPVGIAYDRTLEDRTLLRTLEESAPAVGRRAAAWTTARFLFRNLGLMLRQRWYKFGYACVWFGAPVSLREHLAAREVDPRSLAAAERAPITRGLAEHLTAEVARVVPVLPVPLVAAVFLRAVGEPLTELELLARVHTLADELERAGAQIYVPRRDRAYAARAGLRMLTLRRIVVPEGELLRAVPAERPLLAYYANTLAHWIEIPPAG